jgi:Meiotically up-regulated gene 113
LLYIIKNSESYYKIGYSNDPSSRLKQLSTGSSLSLSIYKTYITENDSLLEAYLHSYFKYQNIQGEWFDLSDNDLMKVDELVDKRNKLYKYLKENHSYDV